MKRASMRDHVSSILVAALSAAFGVLLLEITAALDLVISVDSVSQHNSTGIMLTLVALIFLIIALYVGAVVTTNTFATIIAGRTRTIALLRLIGASAGAERRAVTKEGAFVGVIGAVIGGVLGVGLSWVIVMVGTWTHVIPPLDYNFAQPSILLPPVIVVLATWLSSWVGSRRVLHVTPLEALGVAQERSHEQSVSSKGRRVAAVTLGGSGALLLIMGIFVGLVSMFGVLLGLLGGILSFTGLVLGAHSVMPRALRLTGRLMGRGAEATLASENAVRHPERSSRMTIGLVVGVTLITMFAVATQTYQDMIHRSAYYDPSVYGDLDQILAITVAVFSLLIGVSALIAGVGMVNNMSLSVLQRQRELGFLRALGFSGAQVRRMLLLEATQYTVTSLIVGLVLGTLYGWAGAQSILGASDGVSQVIPPGIPWIVLGILILATVILTLSASLLPARKATRITPITALALT